MGDMGERRTLGGRFLNWIQRNPRPPTPILYFTSLAMGAVSWFLGPAVSVVSEMLEMNKEEGASAGHTQDEVLRS